MKKESFEKLEDWYINLYEQWIFVRCFEKSAILISQITWYRVYVNVDKKTWFVFLELWFPKDKKNWIIKKLEIDWYKIRLIEKSWDIVETIWSNFLEQNIENLKKLKKDLIKFE
jgi:hypothetical protein